MKKFRIILLCVIIFYVLVFSLIRIIYIEYNKYQENIEIQKLQIRKEVYQDQEETSTEDDQDNSLSTKEQEILNDHDNNVEIQEEKVVLNEYKELYEENQDMYGWIKIEDTEINYPVMYTPEDPNYYINKSWSEEYSDLGSIYIDGNNNLDDNNIIIYGHNMKNGSMFGSLKKYKEKSYYETHRYIELDSIYQTSKYEIIFVSEGYVNPVDEQKSDNNKNSQNIQFSEDTYFFYKHRNLESESEFLEYIENLEKNSYYQIENSAKYGDKLITLCTCDKSDQYTRLLIVAKKIE